MIGHDYNEYTTFWQGKLYDNVMMNKEMIFKKCVSQLTINCKDGKKCHFGVQWFYENVVFIVFLNLFWSRMNLYSFVIFRIFNLQIKTSVLRSSCRATKDYISNLGWQSGAGCHWSERVLRAQQKVWLCKGCPVVER